MTVSGASISKSTSELDLHVFPAPGVLSKYFLSFISLEVHIPEGETITDLIVSTWGLVSWRDRPAVSLGFRSGDTFNGGLSGVLGPFDHAAQLFVGPMRQWSAVMLPAGWVRFVDAPAKTYANRAVHIDNDPAFEVFRPLTQMLFKGERSLEAEFALICERLMPIAELPRPRIESRVNKVLLGLMRADLAQVGDLAECAGMTRRTLERVCDNAFGLPPRMLLRRQRFLRSIAQHMSNPEGSWIDSIDHLYHDQPQFVREFRKIMGMTPSEFAQIERPLVESLLLGGVRYWQEVKRLADVMRD